MWTQAKLNVNEGGVGLKDAALCIHTGYVASLIDCSEEINRTFPSFLDQDISPVQILRDDVEWMRIQMGYEVFNVQSVLELKADKPTEGGKPIHLQAQLTKRIEFAYMERFKDSLDTKHLAWYTSVFDSTASSFIHVLPKCPEFTFSSEEMRILLNHRFFLPQPDRSHGMKCICKNSRNGQSPIIDERGHHLITGCNKRSFGMAAHNAVVHALNTCFHALGYSTKKEPDQLFTFVNGDFTEIQRNLRPDLLIRDINHANLRGCAVDVSMTCPIPMNQQRNFLRQDAQIIDRASSIRYQEKVNKYNEICHAIGIKFQPFIIETTGRVHSSSLRWLKNAFDKKRDEYIGKGVLFLYWNHRIGCAFQHQVAKVLIDTFNYQKGIRHAPGYENQPSFIYDGPNDLISSY